jgi:4-hydroxy-3-polyprenylbenzoate decarboxylase
MDFPLEGVFHNCAIASIKKSFPLHANKVMNSLWGLGQMMYTKMIVIVDENINVHDYSEVLKQILSNITTENQLVVNEGPLDALDHASDRPFQGFRLGVDATHRLPSETGDMKYGVSFANEVNIIPFDKSKGINAKAYLSELSGQVNAPGWVLLVDKWINPNEMSTVAWKLFNNIDARRDMIKATRNDGSLFVGIDATRKGVEDGHMREWPEDIEMSAEVKAKVDERWIHYGLSES